MNVDKNPEEQMLDELRHSYSDALSDCPTTPYAKTQRSVKSADEVLRQHQLELEMQIQSALSTSTQKMGLAQTVQKMAQMINEAGALLESGEDAFAANKQNLTGIVNTLGGDVEKARVNLSDDIMKSFVASISSLAQASSSMLQSRQMEKLHADIDTVKQILSEQQAPKQQVH